MLYVGKALIGLRNCWDKGSASLKKEVLGAPVALGARRKLYKDSTKPPQVLQYSLCPWKSGCEGPEGSSSPKVILRSAQKPCVHISWHCHEYGPHDLVKSHGVPSTLHFHQDKSNYSRTWSQIPWEWFILYFLSHGPHLVLINPHGCRNIAPWILRMCICRKKKYDSGYFFNLEKADCWFGGIIHSYWHKGCKKIQLVYAMKAVMK